MDLRISIITVCLNSERAISGCIDAVISQNVRDIEHIIIDGGSSDRTVEIIREYGKTHEHIKYISESDGGIYDAINKGVSIATGEIVGILHDSDRYNSEDVLLNVLASFKGKPIDVLYGDLLYINKRGKAVRYWRAGTFEKSKLILGWMPPHPTVFLRNSVLACLGNYDTRYKISSDYDFMLKLFKRNPKYYYMDKVLVRMESGGASNGGLVNILKKTMEDYKIIKRNNEAGIFTLLAKNIMKIPQFITKR